MALIFDIETIGENFDDLDGTTQEVLTRWIQREYGDSGEYEVALKDVKEGLGFSPLTGQIVAIGVLDSLSSKGAVYFQAPDQNLSEVEEGTIKLKPTSEKEMLMQFWALAEKCNEFVSFNGRAFDVPFLMIRSAIYSLRPSKDLMSNRYLSSQKYNAQHIDLLDQLSFYGAMRRKGALHLWCRAFGIQSPKAGGVTGDEVGTLFAEKRYLDIAKYNAGDLFATKMLFDYWQQFLKF